MTKKKHERTTWGLPKAYNVLAPDAALQVGAECSPIKKIYL
jgi:hypothetical protein